jgi:hypothetical protein
VIGYWLVVRRKMEEGEPEEVVIDDGTLAPATASAPLGRID